MRVWRFILVLAAGALTGFFVAGSGTPVPRVLILGLDGLDPRLLDGYLQEGILPNFQRLISDGHYSRLQTTVPPLSPVAWSTFTTGMDPGGHGVFDFLKRREGSMMPALSMSRAEPPSRKLEVGSWVIPLGRSRVELLREGKAFWQVLEEAGVPTTVFKMPANFPPAPSPGQSLSGMGTPDILGTPGTFSFYTTSPPRGWEMVAGGKIYPVEVEKGRVQGRLRGPANSFRREKAEGSADGYHHPDLWIDFEAYLDPVEKSAKITVQEDEFVLREGEWSDWIRVDFVAVPYMVEVSAAARFYLKELFPEFKLYVSPLQITPVEPAMQISTPGDWAQDLCLDLGHFYTQGLPEDTKAFSAGVFSGEDFWEQAQFVYRERRRALDYLLDHFDEGLLFFYFSSVDQGCHMLWRYMDENHPQYQSHPLLSSGIRTLYRQIDEALGEVLNSIDEETTLIVMSDHGFAPFYRSVNLNSWLLEGGYVELRNPKLRGRYPAFANVDWSQTRAYALGLNGIYVNLRNREPNGVVSDGEERENLLDRLEEELLAATDPETGEPMISRVVRPRRDFTGPFVEEGPDLIVGWSWGYRSSWESPLGEFPGTLVEDNLDPWSGDHSLDNRLVPGVLISNRPIILDEPGLADLTVAVLDEYGLESEPGMVGEDCLGDSRMSGRDNLEIGANSDQE